jgi:folate-binding protein YgfZ
MSQTSQITGSFTSGAAVSETPLASLLSASHPELPLISYQGALSVSRFSSVGVEMQGFLRTVGICDLGSRSFIRITGEDRVRWLNGMVTNSVQGLTEGRLNDSFLLNAQGRILGDAIVYRFADHLLLETARSQSERLLAHLDHFIIMDDVELQQLDASTTTIGIAGPNAASILTSLGVAVPEPLAFVTQAIDGIPVTIAHVHSPGVPRFEIRCPANRVLDIWTTLVAAGTTPCGVEAVESLRILEAIPLYGTDITDRYLAQETNQPQVLHFSKGCYLGQEIVERIRSRATVHRGLRQFSLTGDLPHLSPGEALPLHAGEAAIGELTSVARIGAHTLALGIVRNEALERKQEITYPGGLAAPLSAPPTGI